MNNKLSNKFIIKSNLFVFLGIAIGLLFLQKNILVVRPLFYIFCFNVFIEVIVNSKYKYEEENLVILFLSLLPCHIICNIVFLFISHLFDKYATLQIFMVILFITLPIVMYNIIVQRQIDSTKN